MATTNQGGNPAEWFSAIRAATNATPPTRPNPMIVVRRRRVKRFPQNRRPEKRTSRPTPKARLACHGSMPCIRTWSANSGDGSWTSWKMACVPHDPRSALSAIQVGARSHTGRLRRTSR